MHHLSSVDFDPAILALEDEREMGKMIGSFPEVVAKAGQEYDPSLICTFLYDLSKTFSHWYHDNQILKAESPQLIVSRITLCKIFLQTIKNAFA